MELTVQNLYGLLLRSRLLSIDEARSMFDRWKEESGDQFNNLARFAGWMVSNKFLTEYQASLLARGHADGFFVNEYKILDRLGQGRMAGVYRGQHQLGQIVAIKVLPPSKAQDPTMLERFHREARLALRLKHHNIVQTYQTGVARGLHYLVMEYLEGETLEEVLNRRRRLPPAEAVRIVYQALLGLQHIHTQQLLHRDLKPANLMLVPQPLPGKGGQMPIRSGPGADNILRCVVKILDIGLGRALFEEGNPIEDSQPGLTAEGVLLGTPDYMSPEQARDPHGIDIRSDIYSLGCVLYHCLAGQPPFPDTNIITQMIRHASEPPRPLKEYNPEVPDGLQQIVNWMLAKEPGQRYPTPERAAQALQVFLAAGSALPEPVPDARMRSYLTWLEKEQDMPAAAQGTSRVSPAVNEKPRRSGDKKEERARSAKKDRHRHRPARHKSPDRKSPPPADSAEGINVELIPLARSRAPDRGVLGLQLSRRDFAVFGIGAAAGGLATFLGCLLALLSRSGRDDPPRRDKPEEKEP
jgi:serine/threonine protein kinase